MKVLFILSAFVFFISCKQEMQSPVVEETKPEVSSTPRDTITKDTFLSWTNQWKMNGKGFTDTLLVRYYDMPVIDLVEVIGEAPAKARFFHGLENLGGGHYEPHLIVAGVDASGNVIEPYLDITKPCPTQCGTNTMPE